MPDEGSACFTVSLVPKRHKTLDYAFHEKDKAQENLNICRESAHVINGFSALKNNIYPIPCLQDERFTNRTFPKQQPRKEAI